MSTILYFGIILYSAWVAVKTIVYALSAQKRWTWVPCCAVSGIALGVFLIFSLGLQVTVS